VVLKAGKEVVKDVKIRLLSVPWTEPCLGRLEPAERKVRRVVPVFGGAFFFSLLVSKLWGGKSGGVLSKRKGINAGVLNNSYYDREARVRRWFWGGHNNCYQMTGLVEAGCFELASAPLFEDSRRWFFLRRPRTDCLLIKLRMDDWIEDCGVVGLRRPRCEDFERSCWIEVRGPGGLEIGVKKMPRGSGPRAAFFSKSLEFSKIHAE